MPNQVNEPCLRSFTPQIPPMTSEFSSIHNHMANQSPSAVSEEFISESSRLLPEQKSESEFDESARHESSSKHSDISKKHYIGPIINLVNVIVGVGILGLPFAFTQVGILGALLLLIAVALGTVSSFRLLLESSSLVGEYGYPEIAAATMGRVARILTSVVIILDSFGSLSAFLVIVADSTNQFVKQYVPSAGLTEPFSYLLHKSVLLSFSLILIIPLSLLKDMSALSISSFLSLLPLAYLIVLEIVYFAQGVISESIKGSPSLFGPPWGLFVALPIIVFAFSSQLAIFPIYAEERAKRDVPRRFMEQVGRISVTACGVCYLVAGLFGQLTFPTSAAGNIMINYGKGLAIDVLLISMALSVVFGYPLMVFPCRDAIDNLLFPLREKSYIRLAVESMLIITLTYAIAALIPSFSTLLGLSGSITKTSIAYILPPLFYLRASKKPFQTDKLKWLSVILLTLGSTAGALSAYITISDFASGKETVVNA